MTPSRRLFLRSSGLALVSFGLAPRALVRAVQAAEGRARRKTLVVVFQRGACDGLNTVVPYADDLYRRLRPSIAVPAPNGSSESALDLDGHFGLHPALAPLLPFWKERSLAIVQAIGSPDATRSHFDAQDFMESGTPGRKATDDGWLNRHLAANPSDGHSPFRGVSLTPTLPRALQGRAPAVAMTNLRSFAIRGGSAGTAARGFEDLYDEATGSLRAAGQETFEAVEYLKQADPARYQPAPGASYPRGKYGDSLKQIAQLIKADVGLEAAFTDIGGWDHHAAEGGVQGQLAQRLREFGAALAAFHLDLGDRMRDVVLVTLTEFGRTARENGNRGTDHGHASVAFVLGGSVNGGRVHGRWPGLAPDQLYEGRDLAVTTDFRDLLGEVLARHLDARDLKPVFPGYEPRFPGVLRG